MSEVEMELVFNMDEDFECPETFRGHEIVSYMQLGQTRWFHERDFQCMHRDCNALDWTDETYAMFTSNTAVVPCTGCGRFTFLEYKPKIEGLSLRRRR